jgi:NAD(P)-dependent dehydrogenase (short-subunit alcohol dehydrogenase family)
MQTAIVTGASSGIGFRTATMLVEHGISVLGVGRDEAKLSELRKAAKNPEMIDTLSVDLTGKDAPKQVVDKVLSRWGQLDYLINNAGLGKPKPLHETDDEMLDLFLDVMLRSPFRLSREAIPHMKPGSAIINVTSTFAVVGGLRGGAYSAAKGGLASLTGHMAAQYGPQGIRCNAVAPGVIPTPMTNERLEDPKFKKMQNHMTPLDRFGTVDDIASTIAFLCSKGGSYINGQTIVVDGGWSSTRYLSDFALRTEWVDR